MAVLVKAEGITEGEGNYIIIKEGNYILGDYTILFADLYLHPYTVVVYSH
jgi:hypothetical protein